MNLAIPTVAWSYSRLHDYEVCPRRFYELKVNKTGNYKETQSDFQGDGLDTHKAMALALTTRQPLPLKYQIHQRWIDRLWEKEGGMVVEQQWAITKDLKPCAWFSDFVWCRAQADVAIINKDVGLVSDWKTGKSTNADEVQLVISALIMFAHFPQLKTVGTEYVWLNEDRKTSMRIDKNEISSYWADIMPRVKLLEQAVADQHFPPKPGRFCRSWCPVRSCEHWGK